jgi:NTE family protein
MGWESLSFFEGLSEEEVAAAVGRLPALRFPAGSLLIARGDTLADIYVIQSGTADIFFPNRDGAEECINHAGPGDTLGEMAFFTGEPASASVRARTDVVVLVLDETTFAEVSAAFPRIYRNLGAILSARLLRSNHLSMRPLGRLTLLREEGGPPLLGPALACSIAWHTRRPTLFLLVTDRLPAPEQKALAAAAPGAETAGAPGDRAHLVLARPEGPFAPENLPHTVERFRGRYNHVLVQVDGEPGPLPATARVRLVGTDGRAPARGLEQPGHTVRGWAEGLRPRPGPDGVLHVPPLAPADEESLRRGLLPATTPAGRALGWEARHLAGLKVGLALGGGTEKGYAHLGVLRVLERTGIPVDYLAGTSIGSVVAALRAMGLDLETAAKHMDDVGASLFRLCLPTASFLSSAGLRTGLQRVAGERRIEDLEVPLGVVATDAVRGQEVVFRSGLLWQAVLASCSLPGIYPPQCIGPHVCVDGGVVTPVPGNVAADMGANVVIAVKLTNAPVPPALAVEAREATGRPPWALQTIWRCIDLMYTKIEALSGHAATILIVPMFQQGTWFSLRRFPDGRAHIRLGEEAAEAALPRILAALPWLRP